MGTKFQYPSGLTTTFNNPIAPNEGALNGSHFSHLGVGGMHEVIDLDERNDITTTSSGEQTSGNIFSSGRRQVGMLVHVYGIEEPTIYKLIPDGYWGNSGTKGYAEWAALTARERTSLLDPYAVFIVSTHRQARNQYYKVIQNGKVPEINGVKQENLTIGEAETAKNTLLANEQIKNACWVKLELGGDTTPYVNGVQNKPGSWTSVNQTGENDDAPAVYGNKKFINSELHLKYSASDTIGGPDHLTDAEDDAALKVDKKVTIGTAAEEIFSVKENIINLHTITNAENFPNVTAQDVSDWGRPPVSGDSVGIAGQTHTFKVGDLYTFKNPEGHTILGIIAT